jgi:hypothetical protein
MTRFAVNRALERAGLRTERAVRLAQTRNSTGGALTRECARHGITTFARDSSGTYRCTRCSADAVSRRRRKIKITLIREAGGACALCGYNKCVGALAFHHLDPASKVFGMAEGGVARSLEKCRREVAKCVLLCANCHAEVEAGVTALPPLKRGPPRPIPSLGS